MYLNYCELELRDVPKKYASVNVLYSDKFFSVKLKNLGLFLLIKRA